MNRRNETPEQKLARYKAERASLEARFPFNCYAKHYHKTQDEADRCLYAHQLRQAHETNRSSGGRRRLLG